MPFRGPSRLYQPPGPSEALAQALDAEEASRARRESASSPGVRTDYAEFQARMADQMEGGKAELAMTPGVRRGVADSAGLNTFQRYGDSYTYDPQGAANQAGAVAGARETAQNKAKYDSLVAIPGISQKNAARIVYGRSGIMDADEEDSYKAAMSDYMRVAGSGDPAAARAAASKVLEHGGSLDMFRDRFMGEEKPTFQKTTGPHGEIGRMNMLTGEVEWSGEVGVDAGARLSAAQQAQEDRAAAVESRFARSQASTARREMQGLLGRRPRALQFVDPQTRQPDEAAFNEAMRGWRADSTMVAGAISEADAYVKSLGAPAAAAPGQAPAPVKTVSDMRSSGLLGQSSAGAKKQPSAQQLKDAANDPGYRAYLIARGYDLGGGE